MSKKTRKHKQISQHKDTIVLLSIIALFAFALRFYLLPQHLFFGPEQGIDFGVIRDIATGHKLTLIGAKTDISGVFHGPLYYYISAIPFFLTSGNPVAVSIMLVLLQALTVFPLYSLGKELWNKRVGLLAVLLFTVSYGAIVYSRWLSAQPIALPLVCLFFYSFVRFLKGNNRFLLLTALCFGLLVQSQFLNLILFSGILLTLILVFYKKIIQTNLRILIPSIFILGVTSIGNFVLFDLKHQFLMSNALSGLLSGKNGFYLPYTILLASIFDRMLTFYTWTLTPSLSGVTVILFIVAAILLLKNIRQPLTYTNQTIVAIWLFVPLVLFFILHHDVIDHYFIPFIPAYLLTIAYGLDLLITRRKLLGYFVVVAFIALNLFTYVHNIPTNSHIFFQATQPTFYYSDQQKVISEIYKRAGNKPFSIQAYTIPYWVQDGWHYLFWYKGTTTHQALPVKDNPDKLFVIVQDDPSDQLYQNNWLKDTVSRWGKKEVGSFRYGDITVLIRQVK